MSVRKVVDRGRGGQRILLEKNSNTVRYDIYIFFKIFFQLSIKQGHVWQNCENQQDKYYSGQMIGKHFTICWKSCRWKEIIS